MLKQALLIVDDQPEIRTMLKIALGDRQFRLIEAADGDSALALARSERPEAILLDVMIPGRLDGIDVCREVKRDPDLAGTYVVMLTARGMQDDVDAATAAGADAYLVKPCRLNQLVDIIESRPRPRVAALPDA